MKKTGRSKDQRPPGRPRDPRVEDRILRVTLKHLADYGYARMSIDAIASDSGASKPTIYRRWSGKADLATAALTLLRLDEPPPPGGPAPARLKVLMRNFRSSLLRPNGMALIGTILAEEEHTPELLVLFRERIVSPRREMIRAALAVAASRGELKAGSDIEAAVNMLVGALYARYLSGEPLTPDWTDSVVDVCWRGLAAG